MAKSLLAALFCLSAVLCESSAGHSLKLERAEGSGAAMGGVFTVVAYGNNRSHVEQAIAAALQEARRLDDLLSNYSPSSEWSRVNRLAGLRAVHISKELFDLLAACQEYSRKSDGAFDITVAPLMKAWGFFKDTGYFPTTETLREAKSHVGWRNILLDPVNQTVQFTKDGIEIDPGGIGKGYAVDRMANILRSYGIDSALISAASSSIYAIGAPPDESAWHLDIPDPDNPHVLIQKIELRDESISTSGTYNKFFVSNGRIYSHIMDPRTGFPATGMASASVIAPRTIDSEAWAKPYFIRGRQWAAQHLQPGFQIFLCERRDSIQAKASCAWVM